MSSEKPDVVTSSRFLINFICRSLAKCDRKNQMKSLTAITHDATDRLPGEGQKLGMRF
jgi:hypothetical protein